MLPTFQRWRGKGIALGIAGIFATAALAACSAGADTQATAATNAADPPSPQAAATPPPDAAPAAPANTPPSRQYKLDKGLVALTNSLNGEKIEITITKVVDPAVPGPGAATPDPGDRFVAVQYQIHNIGTLPFDGETVQMSAVLNDRQGQQFKPVFVQPKTSAGPNLPESVSVMPGQKRLGYVVFELPDTSLPGQAQWSMGMGFGGTAMWDISGG